MSGVTFRSIGLRRRMCRAWAADRVRLQGNGLTLMRLDADGICRLIAVLS